MARIIREWRERERLTRREAGDRLCVTEQTVYLWETGQSAPPRTRIAAVADVVGVAVSELAADFAATDEAES